MQNKNRGRYRATTFLRLILCIQCLAPGRGLLLPPETPKDFSVACPKQFMVASSTAISTVWTVQRQEQYSSSPPQQARMKYILTYSFHPCQGPRYTRGDRYNRDSLSHCPALSSTVRSKPYDPKRGTHVAFCFLTRSLHSPPSAGYLPRRHQ